MHVPRSSIFQDLFRNTLPIDLVTAYSCSRSIVHYAATLLVVFLPVVLCPADPVGAGVDDLAAPVFPPGGANSKYVHS